ncbi:MAG TPA: glycosyltransferase [Ramlibacter sp.]|nr:glycosyltransferase [Ramlibacter sp.]
MAKATDKRWQGELEGLESGLLYGWCIDTQEPGSRVVIDISLEGQPVGIVTADVARIDLLPRFEKLAGNAVDVCHGFVADLRVFAADSTGTLTASVANTRHALPGRVTLFNPKAPPPAAGNLVFGDGSLRLHGWCKPGDTQPGGATVTAYVGSRKVATAKAGLTHAATRHFGVERDGFVLDLPPELADGRVHLVRVVDETGNALNGSPLTVCCFLNGARSLLKGRNDILDAVLDSYERVLPRSLGMAYYAAWRAEFEMPQGVPPTKLRTALVITGQEGRDATKASIDAQQGAKAEVFASARDALASKCDVIGFIRAGDTLREHALATALEAFADANTVVAYTDSEFEGRPWFKPAWNADYAFATDYPLELMLVRLPFAARYTPKDGNPEPSDLAWHWLAAASVGGADAIAHVPRALYVWNSAPSDKEKQQRKRAASAALQRVDPNSRLDTASGADPLFLPRRIVRPLTAVEEKTRVSLIVPTRDRAEMLERCVESIRTHTKWAGLLEITVVDNDSVEPATHTFLQAARKSGIRVIEHPGPFNFSQMNNRAVHEAQGEIIGLINNDIEALHDGWLDEIVGQLLRPGVGAVGAKLVWPNGMVQHGGVVLGVGNAAGHYGNQLADEDWGDHGRNRLAQQVSAVTAACMFFRKKDYVSVGGMDETAFPVTFNDVDLCLKFRARGQTIVWTPFARLLHAESASRGKEDAPAQRARAQRELENLRKRWGSALLRDPAYHPSLNLDPQSQAFGGLALPPRDRQPRSATLPDGNDT